MKGANEMNDTDKWWVSLMETQLKEIKAFAEQEYRSEEKRKLFLDGAFWALLNARPKIWEQMEMKQSA